MANKFIRKNFRLSDVTASRLEDLITLMKIEHVQKKQGDEHDLDHLNQTRIIEILINREYIRLINELNGPPVSRVLDKLLKRKNDF